MKQCPCCNSGRVKEYKFAGRWGLRCDSCGYDSLEEYRERLEREQREQARRGLERKPEGW